MTAEHQSIRSILSKEVYNYFQKFEDQVTGPQIKNLRELATGILESGSLYLARIANKVSKEITLRNAIARFETHLSNVDHFEITKTHILKNRYFFSEEKKVGKKILLFPDNSDIQKPYSKSQELICKNIDGSNGHKPGRGYWTLGLMAYGTETKKTLPLCHHLFSTKEKGYKSLFEEQKKCMDLVTPLIVRHETIVVEDRIGDDATRIKYYRNDLGCGFIVRLKNQRKLEWEKGGEIIRELPNVITEQIKGLQTAPRQWYCERKKQLMTSGISWVKVTHPDLTDKEGDRLPLYLVAVYTDGLKDPLIILTDQIPANPDKAWEIFFFYKKRWEIEKFFYVQKQKFGLEDIKILGYKSIQMLTTMAMLTYGILQKLHYEFDELFCELTVLYKDFCRREQREGDSITDTLEFIRDTLIQYPPFRSNHFWRWRSFLAQFLPNKNQLSLFPRTKKC